MDGFLYENGPYYFEQSSTNMTVNRYAWNTRASMLYFEAPVGVGFSIAGNAANLETNDNTTASDNSHALGVFFEGFPEYA